MKCPSCDTYNNEYHVYCYNCGTKLISQATTNEKDKVQTNKYSKASLQKDTSDELNLLYKSFESVEPNSDINIKKSSATDIQATINEPNENNKKDNLNKTHSYTYSNDYVDESLPLRRNKKDKTQEDASLKTLIRVCSTIIILSILIFAALVFYDKVIKKRLAPAPSSNASISATYSAVQDTIDNVPVHKIIVETDVGELVKILDKTVRVKDGKAEVVIEDKELVPLGKETSPDGEVKVTLDVIISATNTKSRKDKVSFRLAPRTAPLNMIHPTQNEYIAEDDNLTLLMEVIPGSKVLINGDNFSDMVSKEGKLEKTFKLSEELEQKFEVKVVTEGFKDNIHTITIKRNSETSHIPLTIDQKQPIKSDDQWVKITGSTAPGAKLDLNVEVKYEPKINEDGHFTIFAKTANIGYTPCTLTSSLENGETTSLNLVLERSTTEAEYTSKAWEFIYDDMVKNQSLHNSQIFLLTGKVSEIFSLDGKYAFTLDISPNSPNKQLVYIEYWGNIKLEKGQSLKIFGNRWGNKDSIPKILAKFIYKI